MEYYLITTVVCFACSLVIPSNLKLGDNLVYSAMWSLLLGWLVWPFMIWGAYRFLTTKR